MTNNIMSSNKAREWVYDLSINNYNINRSHKHSISRDMGFEEIKNIASMQIPIFDWTQLGLNNCENSPDSYLGIGTSGTVLLGSYRGKKVAVKTILCDELDLDTINLFYKEALLSITMPKHKNIVQFLGIAIQPPELCLIYEYCSHRSLTNVLKDVYKIPLNYINILHIALDIGIGMEFTFTRYCT